MGGERTLRLRQSGEATQPRTWTVSRDKRECIPCGKESEGAAGSGRGQMQWSLVLFSSRACGRTARPHSTKAVESLLWSVRCEPGWCVTSGQKLDALVHTWALCF